ncbi:MAG: hypothetical protein K9J27_11220 [Bacteroidales bacterium]|nr:hypothetical protein [Bacteroidales bacterium]
MRTKLMSLLVVLLLTTATTYGQRSTFFGFGGALNYDVYEFTDPGNMLRETTLPAGSWGFFIGQEISEFLMLETGFVQKEYWEGYSYNVESPNLGYGGSSFIAYQFPLRLKSKINLKKKRITLNPVIGVHYSINMDYGYGLGYGGGTLQTEDIKISTTYTEDVNLKKSFLLLETGLQLEFVMLKDFLVGVNAGYLNGFDKVSQIEYDYGVNDGELQKAYAHNNGSYWNFGLAVSYRVSDFWLKE